MMAVNFSDTSLISQIKNHEKQFVMYCKFQNGDVLLSSAVSGDVEKCKEEVITLADPSCMDECLNTPLHIACMRGYTDLAGLLINLDADLHCVNVYGKTAIQEAVYHEQEDIRQLLLKAGAQDEYNSREGWTDLHH